MAAFSKFLNADLELFILLHTFMKTTLRKISIPFTYCGIFQKDVSPVLWWTMAPCHWKSPFYEQSHVREGTLSAEIQGAIKPIIPATVNRNYVWTSKGKWVLLRLPSFAIKRFWTLIRTFAQRPSKHSERVGLCHSKKSWKWYLLCLKVANKKPPFSKHFLL